MKFFATDEHPALCFKHLSPRGEMRRVVVMRSTFEILPEGGLRPCSPAPPLNFRETAFGHVTETPLRFESDLAPEKAKVDLVVHANAYAPDGRARERFDVALAVREPDRGKLVSERRITVTGPREWRYRGMLGWVLSESEPTLEVPLRFDYAYGGTVRLDDPARGLARPVLLAHRDNPVGRGFAPSAERVRTDLGVDRATAETLVSEWARRAERIPAPQLELPGVPLRSIDEPYPLVGWGLVAKHWGPRYRYAGTYDERWMETRHPLLPLDFDPHYWNGAHPDLQFAGGAPIPGARSALGHASAPGYWPEGAAIELLHCVPPSRASHQAVRVVVPRLRPAVNVRRLGASGPERLPLRLDTVIVDLLADRLTLLHRADLQDDPNLVYVHLEVPNA